jgi:Domain of unknown function (DUF4440)
MLEQRWALADYCQRVYARELSLLLNIEPGGIVRFSLFAVSILSVAAWGQASSDPGTAAAIRASEKQWTVGQARNDSRTLDMIFDDALVYVEYGRLVSKGEYLARIKAQPTSVDQISMDPMTVRTFGNTAIVVGSYTESHFDRGKRTLQRWKFVDTWVYKQKGWVLVAAAAAPVAK